MSNTHKPLAGTLATLTIILATLLAATATPAHASEVRRLLSTFGEERLGAEGYSPWAVTVDQATGNVYVAALSRHEEDDVVDVFGAEGGPPADGIPTQITGAETPGGVLGVGFAGERVMGNTAVDDSCYFQGLSGAACKAFDPSDGDVYVVSGGTPTAVDKFKLNGSKYEYVCQFTDAGSCVPEVTEIHYKPDRVAVDSNGNVYISFTGIGLGFTSGITEYNSAGERITATAEELVDVDALATNPAGDVYFLNGEGKLWEVKHSPAGGLLPAEELFETEENENTFGYLAFDSATGHLFLLGERAYGKEVSVSGEVLGTFGSFSIGFEANGVAVNDETNEAYVTVQQGAIERFGSPVVLADARTGGAVRVHRTSAMVEGVVEPHALATKYFFQYGETSGYGSVTPVLSTSAKTGASAVLEGLAPGETYHYRLVVENTNGTDYGADASFTTPLAVDGVLTGPAGGVQVASAVLGGSVEPDGEDTHVWFEYGAPDGAAGVYTTATPKQDAGSASEAEPAEATVEGLQPHATYHYRLAAENTLGVSYGTDESFTTVAVAPVLDQAPSVSGVTRSGVTVNGAVDPENSQTTFHIVYVDAAEYAPGSSEPYAAGESTPSLPAGSGFGEQPVEQQVGGLKPATVYHYALIASSPAGTVTGQDATFTTGAGTPPLLSTGAASAVSANGAMLSATVATQGLPATYGFEIGTGSTVYGPPAGLGSVGAGAGEEVVTFSLTGLQPGTTYHYRITATNVDGTSYGADESFTTPAPVGALAVPLVLPLIATPQIVFPSGPEANTATPPVKPKSKGKGKRKRKKAKKTGAGKGKGSKGKGKGKGSKGRRKG